MEKTTPSIPSRLKQKLGFIGPGMVYGLTVLGTGDIVSNSAAGASFPICLGQHLS